MQGVRNLNFELTFVLMLKINVLLYQLSTNVLVLLFINESVSHPRFAMVTSSQARKIVRSYYDLETPGSYSGINQFHRTVTEQLGINISQNALRKLLRNEITYQVHYPKKSLFQRANYSRGTNIEG